MFVVRIRTLAAMLVLAWLPATTFAQSYVVESINVPKDISLEVGGMGFWPDGALAVIFLIVIGVLIWRPWGLFGTELRH